MRKSQYEVTDRARMLEIIAACPICRLGFQSGTGVYIVPMNFGFEDRDGRLRFYFHCAYEGLKIDLLRANPHAGIEMDLWHSREERKRTGDARHYQSVIGCGPICIIEEPEEKRLALALVREHTLGSRGNAVSDARMARTCVLRLIPESLTCKER